MDIVITIKNGEELVNSKSSKNEEVKGAHASMYARFFDDSCPAWSKSPEYNLLYLKQQEIHANDLLKVKGYLFLNDVYDMLGIPRSKAGQVVGWVYGEENPIGDNYVDFGLYEESNSESVNGYERSILLDFNVDGCILDKI